MRHASGRGDSRSTPEREGGSSRTLFGDLRRLRDSLASEGIVGTLRSSTRTFTTGRRIAVLTLVTFVPVILLAMWLGANLAGTRDATEQVRAGLEIRVRGILPLTQDLTTAHQRLDQYLATGAEVDRAAFLADASVVDRRFDALVARAPDVDGLQSAHDRWRFVRGQIPADGSGLPGDAAARGALGRTLDDTMRSIHADLLGVASAAAQDVATVVEDVGDTTRSARLVLAIGIPLTVLLALALTPWSVRDLRKATGELRAATEQLERGRFDARVPERIHGDLAPVARAFNAMAARVEAQSKELVGAASLDPLTGVLNRRGFDEELAQELERAGRYGHRTALLLLDIDHFKRVNDRYGHPVGDVVLRAVADEIGEAVRGVDRVGRWGGEEFAVLLPETDTTAARHVARRVNQVIGHRVVITGGHKLRVTASVGVTVHEPAEDGAMSPDQLVERADRALYDAKESGRNRVVFAS